MLILLGKVFMSKDTWVFFLFTVFALLAKIFCRYLHGSRLLRRDVLAIYVALALFGKILLYLHGSRSLWKDFVAIYVSLAVFGKILTVFT